MEQNNESRSYSVWSEVELYCVLHRIWKNLWMVIMSAGLFALLAYIATMLIVNPTYTCSATFVVTPKYSSTAYASGSSAVTAATADQFAALLTSSTLVKRVEKLYGSDVAGATVSSSVVKDTNLIQIVAVGPSPSSSYYMCTGILDNYEDYAQYVFDSVMLESVTSPVVPNRQEFRSLQLRYISIAAPLGALVMIALLSLLTITSGTVQTVIGARNQVDAPLIVTLSHQRKRRTLKSLFRRKKTSLLISNPTTAFVYVETIHQLRSRVEHTAKHHNCKTFLVTSIGENEGKSTVAANLALSLARRHKRVLLVDCDLRKAAQHLIFEDTPEKGSTVNALLQGDLAPDQLVKAIHYRKGDNLFCLYGGNVKHHSADLLDSGRMEQLLNVLRGNFEYVIIDSSPMGFFTDSEVLSDLADASIMVVRQDMLPDRSINDAIDALSRCNARFMGYVFNDVHAINLAAGIVGRGIGGYGYGYSYGYGKGYGRSYGYGYGYSKTNRAYGSGKNKEVVTLETERQKEAKDE